MHYVMSKYKWKEKYHILYTWNTIWNFNKNTCYICYYYIYFGIFQCIYVNLNAIVCIHLYCWERIMQKINIACISNRLKTLSLTFNFSWDICVVIEGRLLLAEFFFIKMSLSLTPYFTTTLKNWKWIRH